MEYGLCLIHWVCPQDHWMYQPSQGLPHLLHLCLQGLHKRKGIWKINLSLYFTYFIWIYLSLSYNLTWLRYSLLLDWKAVSVWTEALIYQNYKDTEYWRLHQQGNLGNHWLRILQVRNSLRKFTHTKLNWLASLPRQVIIFNMFSMAF